MRERLSPGSPDDRVLEHYEGLLKVKVTVGPEGQEVRSYEVLEK
jgi:hypothetical protein